VLHPSCALQSQPTATVEHKRAPLGVGHAARMLLACIIMRVRLGHMLILGTSVLAAMCLLARPVRAAGEIAPAACPGYVSHLHRARSFLADGNRAAAVSELEQAKAALESCVRDDTKGGTAGVVG